MIIPELRESLITYYIDPFMDLTNQTQVDANTTIITLDPLFNFTSLCDWSISYINMVNRDDNSALDPYLANIIKFDNVTNDTVTILTNDNSTLHNQILRLRIRAGLNDWDKTVGDLDFSVKFIDSSKLFKFNKPKMVE